MKPQPLGADGRKRGPGRPRSAEPSSALGVWMPAHVHDGLIRLSEQQDKSISQLVVDAVKERYFDPILKPPTE